MHDFRSKLSDPRVSAAVENYLERARLRRRSTPVIGPPTETTTYGPISINLDLTLACDLRLATDDAVLGLGATRHGIIPDGAVLRLARVGRAARGGGEEAGGERQAHGETVARAVQGSPGTGNGAGSVGRGRPRDQGTCPWGRGPTAALARRLRRARAPAAA